MRGNLTIGFASLLVAALSILVPLTSLAAVAPGVVHGWGNYATFNRPLGFADVTDVKAASDYTLALRSDGTVAAWGWIASAQLTPPAELTNAVAIAAGYYAAMALTDQGLVRVWGAYGHVARTAIINPPASASNVIAIAAGGDHCLALRQDGTVVAWGNNLWNNTAVPANLSNVVQIAAGQGYSLAVTAGGTLVGWGHPTKYGVIPAAATNIATVTLGPFGNALALRQDGTVIAWGDNTSGQVNLPAELTNVVAIASGNFHCVALRGDGTLVTWGANGSGQVSIPPYLTQIRAIAAGATSTLALNSAPLVDSISGPLSPLAGETITLQTTVAASAPWSGTWFQAGQALAGTSAALTLTNVQAGNSGSYVFQASNQQGFTYSESLSVNVQPASVRWTNQPAHQEVLPGAPAVFTAQVVGTDPIRFQWFRDGVPLSGATNATLVIDPVTAGDEGAYTVAASNLYGGVVSAPAYLVATLPRVLEPPRSQLARTNWDIALSAQVLSPTPVTYRWFHDGVELLAATGPSLHFPALNESEVGEYVLVVSNLAGAVTNPAVQITLLASPVTPAPAVLVDWGNTPYLTPAALQDATNVIAVAAGTWHDLGLRADGQVQVWSDSENLGLRLIPAAATNVAGVFAGSDYNLVVRHDGGVVIWGSGPFGTGAVVTPVTEVVSAGCGDHQILLLRRNGRVVTYPGSGFTPPNVTNIVAVAVTDEYCFALRGDGQVLRWLYANPTPDGPPAPVIPGLSNVIALAGGENWTSLALRNDGTVVNLLQSGHWSLVAGITNAVGIAAGRGFAALLATGEVQTWGLTEILLVPEGLRAAQIAGGLLHIAALTVAPHFDGQPQAQTNFAGGSGALTAALRSATPYELQWHYNSEPIPGATNLSLGFTNLRPSQSGNYRLRASNQLAATWSRVAPLTVRGPAELLSWSSNQTLLAGDPFQLAVTFAADPPARAQWQFNGLPIWGETNATLGPWAATEMMTGGYRVALSNSYGVVLSPEIAVTVGPSAPRILLPPVAPGALPDGAALQLVVGAVGTQPLAYQWYFNDLPLTGKTQAELTFAAVSAAQDGSYRVAVSNVLGAVLSDPVSVSTFRAAPAPEFVPGPMLVRVGKSLQLEVWPRGTPGAQLQWRRDGVDLEGETNQTLVVSAVALADAGDYSLWASNAWGTAESAVRSIWVLPNAGPGFVKCWGLLATPASDLFAEVVAPGGQHGLALLSDGSVQAWGANSFGQATIPVGLTNVVQIAAGDNFSLALTAEGTVRGWGQNSAGQATPPAGLSNVIAVAAGVSHGLALKSDGTMAAWGTPGFTAIPPGLPAARAVVAGPNYSLAVATNGRVVAWGAPPAVTNVPAALTNITAASAALNGACGLNTLGKLVPWGSFPAVPASASNVTQIAAGASHAAALTPEGRLIAWGADTFGQTRNANGATNIFALAAWQNNTVALSGLPKILAASPSRTVGLGRALTVAAAALGTPPLAYQWYFAGQPLPGATNPVLAFESFQATNAGTYGFEVRSPYGTVRSNFNLVLGLAPTITQQPSDQAVVLGNTATFGVVATGSATLRYQWRWNDLPWFGATNSTVVLSNVWFEDLGVVAVVVSNGFGTVTSRLAQLQPVPPPALLQLSGGGNQMNLRFTGLWPSGTYLLQGSSNLVDWQPLQHILSASPTLDLPLATTNGPGQFYRLRFLHP